MLQQIQEFTPIEMQILEQSWRGKQILSYMAAYGGTYSFCRFFRLQYDEGEGWMLLFNATLLICTTNPIPTEELVMFVAMQLPFRIEAPKEIIDEVGKLPNYQKLHRATFRLTASETSLRFDASQVNRHPKLADVYGILKEGFPNLSEYGLWLTDVSHRVRHKMSQVMTYQNDTTLTRVFDWKGNVLIGQVATRISRRGSGLARDFLKWTASELEQEGKNSILYALDVRNSFYHEIGFQQIAEEQVLERIDVPHELQDKGEL